MTILSHRRLIVLQLLSWLMFLMPPSLSARSLAGVELTVPRIFSSNMVLQQGRLNPVWGTAAAGQQVTLLFAGRTLHTRADQQGKWKLRLPSMNYGGPYSMVIKSGKVIEFKNIMIGEVWVCSGQSNMGMQMLSVSNARQEIAAANYPLIRLFSVSTTIAQFPRNDLDQGQWVTCNPENIKKFTAVGYFFGRRLHKKLKVAVGLISSSVGGTMAETWISPAAMENDADFSQAAVRLRKLDIKNDKPDKIKAIIDLAGEFPVEDRGIVGGVPVYADPKLNVSDWKDITVPALWNPLFVGVGWCRRTFNLTDKEAASGAELYLSKIDDDDISYLNGQKIGSTTGTGLRSYSIPSSVLKPGENVLVVRVDNRGSEGGLCGIADDMFLETAGSKKPLAGRWKFKLSMIHPAVLSIQKNDYPSLLYNGMVSPLIPYGIKGVIWYQGEGNTDRARQYRRIFPLLINDWRKQWGQGNFPFVFVSLANFHLPLKHPSESTWAELREAQASALSLPNTGMALAIDLGDSLDLHPKNKLDVGERLALSALKIAYRYDHLVAAGPAYRSMQITGPVVKIVFDVGTSALKSKDGNRAIRGFQLAGSDHKFYFADAVIINDQVVRVISDHVKEPVAVRYAWADNPGSLNLYNKAGLPACPFRTDSPGSAKK